MNINSTANNNYLLGLDALDKHLQKVQNKPPATGVLSLDLAQKKDLTPKNHHIVSVLDLNVPDQGKVKKAKKIKITIQRPAPAGAPAAPAAPQKKNVWTWLKGVFSAIAEFFRSIFGSEEVIPPQVGPASVNHLDSRLIALAQKNSKDPEEWNKLIDSFEESKEDRTQKFLQKEINKNRDVTSIYNDIREHKKTTGLDKYHTLQIKLRYELLKIIQKNPDAEDDLNECLERLGGVEGIKSPAPLKNDNNSCYMDALLQILFASKAFIEALKNTDHDEGSVYKDVVAALKNYYIGLEAGLEAKEINKLRNQFRTAIDKLPKGHGLDKFGGATGQQDAAELLDIIFEALNVRKQNNLNVNLTKVYELEQYQIKEENPQDLALRLKIPPIPERELTEEQAKKAKKVQRLYDSFVREYNSLQRQYKLDKRREKVDIARQLKDDINSKEAPKLTLQEVVNAFFNPEKGESEPLQSAIDQFLAGPDSHLIDDEDARADMMRNATKFEETSTLKGDAPSFLTLLVGREIPGTGRTNTRKIEIPEDGIVHITIDEESVAYRIVGIAGGHIGTGGGHWVANAKVNDKWYFVDDTAAKPTALKSPNDRLDTCGRLYMLERVEE